MIKVYIVEKKEDILPIVSYLKNIGFDFEAHGQDFINTNVFPRSFITRYDEQTVCFDCRCCTVSTCKYKNYLEDITNILREEKLKRILYDNTY